MWVPPLIIKTRQPRGVFIRVHPEIVFFIKGLKSLLRSASNFTFWQYFTRVIKGTLIDFEITKKCFFWITGLNLYLGSASKSNFWQYFNVIKGSLIDLEIGKNSYFTKGLNPNNKYTPNNKNYLRCLLFGEVSIRGKGLYQHNGA